MNNHKIGIDLTVSPFGKVKDEDYKLAVLPWGATEPHNQHLPYLTDCILSQEVALMQPTVCLNRLACVQWFCHPLPWAHKIPVSAI